MPGNTDGRAVPVARVLSTTLDQFDDFITAIALQSNRLLPELVPQRLIQDDVLLF